MKKKYIIFSIVTLVLLVSFLSYSKYLKTTNVCKEGDVKPTKITKGISMNLEQTAGAGDYKTVTQSGWPTEGYVFNEELSKCENGSTLSWDDTKKTVIMQGNVSDKCYVYFDLIPTITLADYVISQYTGTQGSNGIYYHNSTLANGAGDNSYRYAGANPNNYVCFGSDATTCPEDNLYRIIGVFDGKVKLIKASAASSSLLGTDGASAYNSGYGNLYYWSTLLSCPSSTSSYISDNSNNVMFVSNRKNILAAGDAGVVNYCNLWNYSDLNKINLNTNYLNNIGTKWSKMIENSVWRISGYNTSNVVPRAMFTAEITNATKTYGPSDGTSKIGLIYVSDFGFAANPSAWTTTMDNYKNYNDVNWLSSISTWTIMPNSSEEETVFSISNGNIHFTGNVAGTGQKNDVIPAFYLLTSVTYVSGSGTMSDPIVIN